VAGSTVMAGMGDFDQALDLTRETIEWVQAHHANQMLSGTRYARGEDLLHDAIADADHGQFQSSRRLGNAFGDGAVVHRHSHFTRWSAVSF